MKTISKVITVGILLLSTSTFAKNWTSDLTKLNLTSEDITSESQSPMERVSRGPAPSHEGIPSTYSLPDNQDILNSAYKTTTLLARALDEARSLPLGQKIYHYKDSAAIIIQKSGSDPLEKLIRITLNRAVDVTNNVLNIAGNNPELVAQWISNFYKHSYELAISYSNNPSAVITADNVNDVGQYIKTTSIGQYGYFYSTLLWRNQANLTSESAKAVVLVKMLGFLGYDFNNDPRRRESRFKEVIADVYRIQNHDRNYKSILQSFDQDLEPNPQDVAALRVKVYKIWSALASKLNESGLITKPIVK